MFTLLAAAQQNGFDTITFADGAVCLLNSATKQTKQLSHVDALNLLARISTAGNPAQPPQNAIVPNDAAILPPQVFVDNITSFITRHDDTSLVLGGSAPATFVDPEILVKWARVEYLLNAAQPSINLHGQSIANVYDIIEALANDQNLHGVFPGSIDISGGSNQNLISQDAALVAQMPSPIPGNAGEVLNTTDSSVNYVMVYDATIPLSGSSFVDGGSSYTWTMGVQDSPSMLDLMQKAADIRNGSPSANPGPTWSFLGSFDSAGHIDGSDNVPSDFPISSSGPAVVSQSPGAGNQAIYDIQNILVPNGWSVTVNLNGSPTTFN